MRRHPSAKDRRLIPTTHKESWDSLWFWLAGVYAQVSEFLGVRLGNRFEVGYDLGSRFVDCLFLFTVGFVPSEKLS